MKNRADRKLCSGILPADFSEIALFQQIQNLPGN